MPPEIHIGRSVYVAPTVRLDWVAGGSMITIEDEAMIVDGARILCHDSSCEPRTGLTWVAPVHIGRRAYIGADAIILPGVRIGDDAIVGAGSVVTKDVISGTVVAGAPARLIEGIDKLDAKNAASLRIVQTIEYKDYRKCLTERESAKYLAETAERDGGFFLKKW